MRFLGLGLEDRVPDARTIWLFREKPTTAGAIRRYTALLDCLLLVVRIALALRRSGQIVNASLVAIKRLFEQFDAMLRQAGYIAIGHSS